jgi:hypothetical protein
MSWLLLLLLLWLLLLLLSALCALHLQSQHHQQQLIGQLELARQHLQQTEQQAAHPVTGLIRMLSGGGSTAAEAAAAAAASTPVGVATLQPVVRQLHQELHRQQETAAAAAAEAAAAQQELGRKLQEAVAAAEVAGRDLAAAEQQMSTMQQQLAAAEAAREGVEAAATARAALGEGMRGTTVGCAHCLRSQHPGCRCQCCDVGVVLLLGAAGQRCRTVCDALMSPVSFANLPAIAAVYIVADACPDCAALQQQANTLRQQLTDTAAERACVAATQASDELVMQLRASERCCDNQVSPGHD